MITTITAHWENFISLDDLADFFLGPVTMGELEKLGEEVVSEAEGILSHTSKPTGATTAVTLGRDGKKVYWSRDPDAVAKKLLVKGPRVFGSGTSLQAIALVVSDHPNSENFQFGNNGFPTTRFFTGAFAGVADRHGLEWEDHS